ncbi:MAG: chromate resistance protein ChrB domain-containing protein [Beijerinckiaceae bacterium]
MQNHPFSTPVEKLARMLGGPSWPQVIDVRDDNDYPADPRDIPGSMHRREADFDQWARALERSRPVVVSCQKGMKISQGIVARLRSNGWQASSLQGGFLGWISAGFPVLQRSALAQIGVREASVWVTRRRPKIDRAACPWLIRRFIDPLAQFLYVEPDQVNAVASRLGGIAYDIPDCAVTHVGEDCSFDTILKLAGLAGYAPLDRLALIVRGADNARFELAPEAAGLLAVSLGLSELAQDDDHGMLNQAFVIYDGLFAWAARASGETHNWPPKA